MSVRHIVRTRVYNSCSGLLYLEQPQVSYPEVSLSKGISKEDPRPHPVIVVQQEYDRTLI